MSNLYCTKALKTALVAGACLALTTACQTTNQGFDTERDVDVSETLIKFPNELTSLKGFAFKGAKIREAASYQVQTVYFTGGSYSYERYFRGGFRNITKSGFEKSVRKIHPELTDMSEVKTANANVGLIHYATFKLEGGTCFFMQSNYGSALNFRSGTGTEGRTVGRYCSQGDQKNLEAEILSWVKKVRLSKS